jgi:4-amino-4-deoxy-L-arabinose transferase-like glycosyltransferase
MTSASQDQHLPPAGGTAHSIGERIEARALSMRFWLCLGVVVLAIQLSVYPFTVPTHVDEGSYSFYGYNAVTGYYPMYKQGGPWFQHPPMAYVIPGITHALLGKGFYAIRIISALLAGVMVLLTYRLARKLGGPHAALINLWLLVGQAESIRYYCLGGPLPFVAMCIVAAVLSYSSDIKSPYREVLAIFFASLAMMTRTNMCYTWGVVVLFAVFTQERWSHRVVSIVVSIVFPGIFIIAFWPELAASLLQHHLLPVWVREWLIPDPLIETGQRYPIPLRAYPGSLYYLFRYYSLILMSVGITFAWMWFNRDRYPLWSRPWREHRGIILLLVLFAGNLVAHVIGPMLIRQPYVMYAYFNYYAPLAAIIGGLGLAAITSDMRKDFVRGVVVGALALSVLVSLFPQGSNTRWPVSFTQTRLQDVQRASERLAALTTPNDKIFALTCMHEFLIADRHPYPAPLLIDALSLSKDTNRVLKYNRYNYELAESYLTQADVVIVSDYGELELGGLYRGQPGSGQDVVDLIERVVSRDFSLVEEIPATSMGKWRIYRRMKSNTAPERREEVSKP